MSPLPLSPLKKSIYKHFVTSRFHYSRSFEILESMAKIFYSIEGIKFWNWRRPSGKCTLANQKSINISITEKCGCIMWNQQLFYRFSFGSSSLYCQHWYLKSHLFLDLCLAAYIHGNTILNEYCTCDW